MRGICALDEHGSVPLRMIGEYLVSDHVAGYEAADDRRPDYWAARHLLMWLPAVAADGGEIRWDVLRARLGEVASEHPDQLLNVAGQSGVLVHLNAQVLEHRDGPRFRDERCDAPHIGLLDISEHAVAGDRRRGQYRRDGLEPIHVFRDPLAVDEALLHEDRRECRQ